MSKSNDSSLDENKMDQNDENKEEISSENKELEKLKDQLLRTLAENENLRKRTTKDIEQIKKFGHIHFVRDLLSSVDNLTRAVNASPVKKEKLDEPIKNLIIMFPFFHILPKFLFFQMLKYKKNF